MAKNVRQQMLKEAKRIAELQFEEFVEEVEIEGTEHKTNVIITKEDQLNAEIYKVLQQNYNFSGNELKKMVNEALQRNKELQRNLGKYE